MHGLAAAASTHSHAATCPLLPVMWVFHVSVDHALALEEEEWQMSGYIHAIKKN